MQHETATVKKVVKKYTVKDGIEKESISYKATLKSDSEFNDGDNVVVLLLDDFNELDNISADEIQNLKNDVAEKNVVIVNLNESNDKLNAELKSKFDLINDVTAKFKASEKTIVELESDISEKDNIITNHEKTIAELNILNDALHERLNELTDLLSGKDDIIASLDESIVDYKVKIAELNAVDIHKLKDKSDKLDDVKDELIAVTNRLNDKSNVISLLQNQIMELQQLVNYKNREIDAIKNQNVIYKLIGKDATADVDKPSLDLIDISGNLIKEKDDIKVDATDVDADSNKDVIHKI